MALNLQNLPVIDALLEKDSILVQTSEGIKAMPAPDFGIAVSSTSLFETYSMNQIGMLYSQKLSTSAKIIKYLQGDTSDDLYVEVSGDLVEFKKGTVQLVNNTPETLFMTDMNQNQLYWSDNPLECEWKDGMPWKNQDGKKVFIGYEETGYPVIVYKYTVTVLKSITTQELDNAPAVQEIFKSGQDNLRGIIAKTNTDFTFSIKSTRGQCGIKLTRNQNGTLAGELIGSWAGLNDISPEQRITRDNLKEVWYNNQDYYTYITATKLDTSNKIGWYLNNDTTNKVYVSTDSDELCFMYAIPKTNPSTGLNIKEQASNIFGHPLFWKQDMTNNASVTNNKVPLKSGVFAYMTIEETEWPVWIWQYEYVELLKFEYSSPNGFKQSFNDASGNTCTIQKVAEGLMLSYLKSGESNASQVLLSQFGGKLVGNWQVQPFTGTAFDIQSNGDVDHTFEVVTPDANGNVVITLQSRKTFVINDAIAVNITVNIPSNVSNNTVIESNVLLMANSATVSWSSNIVGQDTTVDASASVTEFKLKAFKGMNTSVYLTKQVY